jgi:uncharacterized protein (DUF1499 family)
VFSVVLLATAMFLHRLFSLPTPIAMNLAYVAFAGGALALLMAVLATIGIWRTGRPGTARVVFGILVSLGLLLWPLLFVPAYQSLPNINDVTTDMTNPPAFVELAKQRPRGANPVDYAGPDFARKQLKAYPDIKPIEVGRSTDEVFELALDAVRRLKLDIVNQQVPDLESGRQGLIEVSDRTLIAGFYDDVVIRVTGDSDHARVDVRSASRYGGHDLGRNAARVRMLLKEIVVRLESVVPVAREKDEAKPEAKEERQRSRRSKGRRRR